MKLEIKFDHTFETLKGIVTHDVLCHSDMRNLSAKYLGQNMPNSLLKNDFLVESSLRNFVRQSQPKLGNMSRIELN